MTSATDKPEIGSNAWSTINESGYDESSQQKITQLMKDIKWDDLIKICSDTRHGLACQLSEKVSTGSNNLVRQIIFEDGQRWVARFSIRKDSHRYKDTSQEMLSVVATMKCLKSRLSVPVPEVYRFNTDSNDVGAPYILMEYIHGSTALDLRGRVSDIKQVDPSQFGTWEQDRKFQNQMAALHVEMTSITFDRIGSIYQNPNTQEFYIGPDYESGDRPFDSSMDYYRSLAKHSLQYCVRKAPFEVHDDPSFSIPVLFERLMESYADPKSTRGPFGLAKLDFHPGNILVDENFDIVGLIDVDGIMPSPVEVQATLPLFCDFNSDFPLCNPMPEHIELMERARSKTLQYQQMVQEWERTTETAQNRPVLPGALMLSNTAAILQGLSSYYMLSLRTNQGTMLAFSRLLKASVENKSECKGNLCENDD